MNRTTEENTAWVTERIKVYIDVKKDEIESCRKEKDIKAWVSNSKKMEVFSVFMPELTLSRWTRKKMNVGCERIPRWHRCSTHMCVAHLYVCVQENHSGAHGELVAVVMKENLQVFSLVDAEVASLSSSYSASSRAGKGAGPWEVLLHWAYIK